MFFRKYRNALLTALREANIDPREFRLEDEETNEHHLIHLLLGNSPLRFTVKLYYSFGRRSFAVRRTHYMRGFPSPSYDLGRFFIVKDFEEVVASLKQWLDSAAKPYLEDKFEVEEDSMLPDLWAELDLPSRSAAEPEVQQNVLFSPEEQKQIADALKRLEEEVQNKGLLDEKQFKLLQERTEYLTKASKRLGRRDWLMATAGALIELTVEAGLKSEAARELLQMAGEALRWITHHPPLLLT